VHVAASGEREGEKEIEEGREIRRKRQAMEGGWRRR